MISSGGYNCFSGNIGGSKYAVINGVKVDMSRLNEISVDERKNSDTDKKTYKLDLNCSISAVHIKGSMALSSIPVKFVNSDAFNVSIAGSGDVALPKKFFKFVNISVAGSGDVTGYGTQTQTGNITVAGSGDVKGLHFRDNGSVSVVGSGDVSITASNPDNISKNEIGSGSVRVRRA